MSATFAKLRAAVPAVAVVSLLALTACSGGDGKKNEVEEGPLSKYLSAFNEGEDFSEEKWEKQQKEMEEDVAACMQKEGFEYTPNVQTGMISSSTDDDVEDDGPEWGSLEFAKQYGYGIADWPGKENEEEPVDEGEGEEYFDPNSEYLESLSTSEQEAYNEALWGPQPTEEEIAAMEEDGGFIWEQQGGCQYEAQKKFQEEEGGMMAAYEDPEFKELFEEMNNTFSTIYSDEATDDRVAKLNREWLDCMTEAGHPDFNTSDEANMQLNEEYNEIAYPGMDDWDGESEIPEPDQAAIDKFAEREIEVAVADRTCQDDMKYEDELIKVQHEIEQDFLDKNKAKLDALIAKYGSSKQR